jgi:hypothetical protein
MVMGMDKDFAIDILMAIACCSVSELHCFECPLWNDEIDLCRPWQDEEAVEAVRLLNKERRANGE